jgi:predicted  nucleic acid-binding Zn-ribbon protein
MTKRFFPFALASNDRAAALRTMNPTGLTSAALAAADDGTPIEQQLADSFNANNAVMAYVNGITNSTLPALTPQPAWYGTFSTKFSDAKIHAMAWLNTIAPGLVAIPTGIANYAFTFNITIQNINSALTVLQSDPTNQAAKQTIITGLQSLLEGFSTQLQNAQDFATQITTFATNLTADAAVMQQAAKDAQNQVGYNKQQVQDLQNSINALQSEINTWQKVIAGAGIAAGVSFFVGAVVAIFSFGIGLAFGIIGAAAGIAVIIAGSVKIKQLSAEIAQKQENMSDLNRQITALNVLLQNLQNLITLANAAGEQIKLVIKAWQAMEADITAVIRDLNSAQTDLSKMNLPALQADLTQAAADWETLRAFCLLIAGIKYNQATPPSANLQTAPKAVAA